MNQSLAAVIGAIALIALPAGSAAAKAHRGTTPKTVLTDKQFMREAAVGGMSEVELGKLGVERAQSADVKAFAQRMVDDHSKANDQLKQLASREGVTLPADVNAKERATMTRLAKMSGAEFDKAYMRDMVTDHDKDVSLFERQSSRESNADLKAWIDQTLPTLEEHQHMAKDVAGKIGAEPPGAHAERAPMRDASPSVSDAR